MVQFAFFTIIYFGVKDWELDAFGNCCISPQLQVQSTGIGPLAKIPA
jgi:hypothetical protein